MEYIWLSAFSPLIFMNQRCVFNGFVYIIIYFNIRPGWLSNIKHFMSGNIQRYLFNSFLIL